MRTMGGDFGYNMGFVEDGKLIPPRDERRGNTCCPATGRAIRSPGDVSGNHRGRGQNMLYEDGRVQFLRHLPSPQLFDDPYHNREGWVAPGVDRDDAVLGASEDPPLPVMLISDGPR